MDFITYLANFAAVFKTFMGGNETDVSFLCRKRHLFLSLLVSSERLIFVGGMNHFWEEVPETVPIWGIFVSGVVRGGFLCAGLERGGRMVRVSMSSTSVSTRWAEICAK